MGKAKASAETTKKHILTEQEWKFLKVLNFSLQLHIMKDQIITGYLVIICTQRLGYSEDTNLQFDIDLATETREMTVREASNDEVATELQLPEEP